MKKVCLLLGLSLLVIMPVLGSPFQAEPAFEDEFDDGGEWVTAYGTISASASGGVYTVENTGSSIAVLKHDGFNGANFTYSVDLDVLSASFNYVGILFCWSNNFEGYVFTIADNKQWALQKMIRSGSQTTTSTITAGRNGFIKASSNILKVSKSGDIINLFCNDIFLGQVDESSAQDTVFQSGLVGLIMNEGEIVAYDYALVVDEPEAGMFLTYYEDDFAGNDLDGWYVRDSANTVQCVDGTLEIAQFTGFTDRRQTVVLTRGSYNHGSIRAVANRIDGADDAFYGLIRMALNEQNGEFDALVCQISGDRKRAAYVLSTSQPVEYSLVSASAISEGPIDTLEMTGPPDWQFLVNGEVLPDIDFLDVPDGFDFNAVGFIVDSNVTVRFDGFTAGIETVPVVFDPRIVPSPRVRPTYILGGTGIIYDPIGREVRRYQNNYHDIVRDLGRGQFFVMPEGNSGRKVHRAIIVK